MLHKEVFLIIKQSIGEWTPKRRRCNTRQVGAENQRRQNSSKSSFDFKINYIAAWNPVASDRLRAFFSINTQLKLNI